MQHQHICSCTPQMMDLMHLSNLREPATNSLISTILYPILPTCTKNMVVGDTFNFAPVLTRMCVKV